jgi:hypothetical protein
MTKKQTAVLIIIALTINMVGCTERNVPSVRTEYMINTYGKVEIVVIDSCEYLYGPWDNSSVLTHKGNCSSPIHKHNGGQDE